MSEEKIIKHTQAAVHLITNKEKSWRKKIRELTEEVAIIIFAVSITLAFHNWNDWRSERKIEKDFLTGIKEDLKKEAHRLDRSVIILDTPARYYDTLWQEINTNKINAAHIDSNCYQLLNTQYYTSDNGRFDGFKSSGYLRLIENQTLLKHLTNLYTVKFPFESKNDDNFYERRKADFTTYIGVKVPMDADKNMHISKMLGDPAVRFLIAEYGEILQERIRQKKVLADDIRSVIDEIDRELNK